MSRPVTHASKHAAGRRALVRGENGCFSSRREHHQPLPRLVMKGDKARGVQGVEPLVQRACVQTCPTGVLAFGQVDRDERVISTDGLRARVVEP